MIGGDGREKGKDSRSAQHPSAENSLRAVFGGEYSEGNLGEHVTEVECTENNSCTRRNIAIDGRYSSPYCSPFVFESQPNSFYTSRKFESVPNSKIDRASFSFLLAFISIMATLRLMRRKKLTAKPRKNRIANA